MEENKKKCPLLERNKAEGWLAAILEPLPKTMEKVDRGRVSLYLVDKKLVAVQVKEVAAIVQEEEANPPVDLPEQFPEETFADYVARVYSDVPEAAIEEYPLVFWNKDGDQLDVYCLPGPYYVEWGPNGVEVMRDFDTKEPIGVHMHGVRSFLDG